MSRWAVFIVLAATIVNIVGASLGGHVYRWELIVSDIALFIWVLIAWLWSEIARFR